MKKSMSLVLVFILMFLAISCKKEKPTVTINGVTFGCKINGKQYIPDNWDYGMNIPPLELSFIANSNRTASLFLDAARHDGYLDIYLNAPLTKGRHPLNFNTLSFPDADPPNDNGVYAIGSELFITSQDAGGYVDLIEIDTTRNRVYGTFEFIATDRNIGKQVKVTNGIFKNY